MTKYKLIGPDEHAERVKTFHQLITDALSKLKASETEKNVVDLASGSNGCASRLLWSDMGARSQAVEVLSSLIHDHAKAGPIDRRYCLITVVDDVGMTSDRIPVLRLKPLFEKVARVIRSKRMHAFAIREIHPLMNYPQGGKGRTLLLHVHALAWSDTEVDLPVLEAELNALPGWNSSLGARVFDLKPLGPKKKRVANIAYYLLKPPHSAKNLKRSADGTRAKLWSTIKGYRPELALRVLEGLTQVELMDVTFGINDGKKLRQQFRERMVKWHRSRLRMISPDRVLPADFDIWAFWAKLRAHKGSQKYLPYRIIGGSLDVRPTKPSKARKRGPAASWGKSRKPVRPPKRPMTAFQKRQLAIVRRSGRKFAPDGG